MTLKIIRLPIESKYKDIYCDECENSEIYINRNGEPILVGSDSEGVKMFINLANGYVWYTNDCLKSANYELKEILEEDSK